MKYNVTFSEIVAQLVKVFKSEEMTRDYNHEGEMFDAICGWCGVMAPISREAFIKAFGASVVLMAETKAREEIKAAQERHNATQYHAHTIEADELQGVPAVGGFFWGANSGLKCDDGRGVFGEISALLWRTEEDDEHSRKEFVKRPARLCQAREVYRVTPEEFDRPELADELVTRHSLQGGSASDDVAEDKTWQQIAYNEEARATLYTFGALVTDGVRYYLIDSEGYDYSRYIYVPITWRENLRSIVDGERERIQARKEAEAKQEEEEKAARLAEYKSRCNKWAHLMEDVRPLEKKEAEAFEAYTRTGWKSKSPEGKAHTAAKRATDAARKRNILAMCSAAFPGVKFSVSVHRGWGEDFRVTWQDGPTEAEFNEVADLDLFASSWDTFDGMTDCADVAHAEFTDFSALTMGDRCGGSVKADREISEQTRAAVIAELVAVVPEYDHRDKYGYNRITVTEEQAAAVAQRLGVSASILYSFAYSTDYNANADEIVHRYCWHTSFYKRQDTPTDPEPNRPKKGGKVQDVENDNAPADGLELVEIAGGVAVVGDSRTTYRNRKEIKAHGAKWNKNAQRWEGTEPEAVAALRAWFGLSDEQTTNNTGEPSEGKQKPENVTRSQLMQVVAVARWFGSVEWSTAGILRDRDTIVTDGNEPEAVTLWHRFGRPLNRRACVEMFGEDVTAEGEILHTMADHSAHYTEDGNTFSEWWQAVVEISNQERAPRTEIGELSEVAKSEAVASGAPHYSVCEKSPILQNVEMPNPSDYSPLTGEELAHSFEKARELSRSALRTMWPRLELSSYMMAYAAATDRPFPIMAEAVTAVTTGAHSWTAPDGCTLKLEREQFKEYGESLHLLYYSATGELQEHSVTEFYTDAVKAVCVFVFKHTRSTTAEAVRNEPADLPDGYGVDADRYPVGSVWQYTQHTGAGEFLHEIRKRADRFELVVNIYNREGNGQRFPDKFPTYAAAYEALIRFRPGSRLCSRPYLSCESA